MGIQSDINPPPPLPNRRTRAIQHPWGGGGGRSGGLKAWRQGSAFQGGTCSRTNVEQGARSTMADPETQQPWRIRGLGRPWQIRGPGAMAESGDSDGHGGSGDSDGHGGSGDSGGHGGSGEFGLPWRIRGFWAAMADQGIRAAMVGSGDSVAMVGSPPPKKVFIGEVPQALGALWSGLCELLDRSGSGMDSVSSWTRACSGSGLGELLEWSGL